MIRSYQIFAPCSQSHLADHRKASSKLLAKSLNSTEMTTLHQCLDQESAVESLHSRWSSSSQVIADRPPSQPLSRRSSVQRIQKSDSRWSPGSQTTMDTALSLALARHRILVGPSNVSALKYSVKMKNQETTIKALFTSTYMGKPRSLMASATATELHCAARSA
jgi:hypothetical protein